VSHARKPDTLGVAFLPCGRLERRMHVAVEGAGPTLVHFGPPTPATPLQVTLVRHAVFVKVVEAKGSYAAGSAGSSGGLIQAASGS